MYSDDRPRGLRIAVLAGGESAERTISLQSGDAVAETLKRAGHEVERFDPAQQPLDAIPWFRFDLAVPVLHGGAGEDGHLQAKLERLGVAYTGSGPQASRWAMSKSAGKERFLAAGVPTPAYVLLHAGDPIEHVIAKIARHDLGFPLVIKPDAQGSSLGVSLVREPCGLAAAIDKARRFDSFIIAEAAVAGRELTVAILDRRTLPALEIVTPHETFDYDAKYHDATTQYRFDTGLPRAVTAEIERVALAAAACLGTRGLVRVDVMLDAAERPWVLEVNTSPGMTDHSLAPKAAARAGLSMPALCDELVRAAELVEVHA